MAVDDVAGGELAVGRLLADGARTLGFVTGPSALRQCADRRKGALRRCARPGCRARRCGS
ncbi:hypothetical protein [Actinomadura keratinilytica]|uniref:hypothetical protein n=1 Tax=Actinomadura keratinilytica TaxID=547461 RepID=UPI00361F39DA